MTRPARGLLFFLCAASLVSAADPDPAATPSPGASPATGGGPIALDANASLDMRATTLAYFVAINPGNGFHWVSTAHDSAENSMPGLTLFQIPVTDVVARFAGGSLTEITVSFYNRGDSGALARDKFDGLMQVCSRALTNFTKLQPVDAGKDATDAVKATGIVWQTDKARFLLESSFSRIPPAGFRAEFVRLTITAPEKPKSLIEESLSSMLPDSEKFSGPGHVKTLPNGDVLIQGIPMVDQGDKGYCVVATAERVLRYYGDKVDENELAEIANTSLKKGTSPTAMLDSLKRLSDRLHVKTRTFEDFNDQSFETMLDNYDRVAKSGQHAQALNRQVDSFTKLLQQFDPDILVEARTKNPSDMDHFFRTVQARVNEGIPPLWSVMMGLFPKAKEDDEYGGHMRLIIGYNQKTNEILFSDPWGYGFELERMPLAQAWTITTGLFLIEPLE